MTYNRRLPVYLLIDCSESMAGGGFEAVTQGLAAMISQLRSNPMALETAAISVITFAKTAQQVVPLTDVIRFYMPQLKLGSGTALGAALRLWLDCMNREVVKTTPQQKGDYKPVCFLMTDGEPTDVWPDIADEVRNNVVGKKANLIALACGPDVDIGALHRITGTVLMMKNTDPASFASFFKWVSASVSTASQKLDGSGEQGIGLPNLPQNIVVAPLGGAREAVVPDRYLFLHARCAKQRGLYIIRYGKVSGSGSGAIYHALAAHPIDDFDFGTDGAGQTDLQISSSALLGAPPCPYCQNGGWAMCEQGHIHCCPQIEGDLTLTCPWCGQTGVYGRASFDVKRDIG